MKNSDLVFGLMVSLGKAEYSIDDLKWLTGPFKVAENCIRTTLSRMVSKNVLESRKQGRNAYYRLNRKGQRIGSNVSFSFREPDWSGWDGSWTGVLFSVPGIKNSARYHIRRKLAAYRFATLYPGVWVRPYNINEDHENNLKDILNSRHCSMVRFQYLNDMGKEDIIRLWKLNEINEILGSGLKIINNKTRDMASLSAEEAFVDRMLTGGEMVNILFKDPLLPDEFLPEGWNGKGLRNEFSVWVEAVSERSRPYWSKIFE